MVGKIGFIFVLVLLVGVHANREGKHQKTSSAPPPPASAPPSSSPPGNADNKKESSHQEKQQQPSQPQQPNPPQPSRAPPAAQAPKTAQNVEQNEKIIQENPQQTTRNHVNQVETQTPTPSAPPQQNLDHNTATQQTQTNQQKASSPLQHQNPFQEIDEKEGTFQDLPEKTKALENNGEEDLDGGFFADKKFGDEVGPAKELDEGNHEEGEMGRPTFDNLGEQEGTDIEHWGQLEQKLEKQQELNTKAMLSNWIAEEMDTNTGMDEGLVMQTFHAKMDPQTQFNFRWNPPKSQTLHLKMMVFQILPDGGLMIMHDNEEEQFIEISSRQEGHSKYSKLGKVYIDKSIAFNFDSDYKYFRLTNHIQKQILVIVDLQKLQEVVDVKEVIQNDHFAGSVKKLEAIRQQVISGEKMREHSYKYQWGFLDNQYAHDSRLLGLTGLELLVMIVAAMVQIYFIKNLLDNRAVV